MLIEPVLVAAGRQVFGSDLPHIRSLVAEHWQEGLSAMAVALCRQWSWQRRGGRFNLTGAERVLQALSYRGLIALPGTVATPPSGNCQSKLVWTETPLCGRLSDHGSVRLCLVETSDLEALFDALMEHYHYLGGRRVIGEHLKYVAFLEARPVAALLWGRAALKIGPRDRFIGWSAEGRSAGIGRIANNYRFLVLPWVRIRFLASHVLSLNARVISADWERRFTSGLDYLETFVDPERFKATSYLAANWIAVGYTQGSGRRGPHYVYHGHRKMVLVYPLSPSAATRSRSLRLMAVLPEPIRNQGELLFMARVLAMRQDTVNEEELTIEEVGDLAEKFRSYCRSFYDLFPRSESREHFLTYMTTLMSELPKKNAEFMALKSGAEVPVRTLQHFLSGSRWSDDEVRTRHQDFVAQTLGDPHGVLIFDGSDFVKKGKHSAGVARQYCGASGKIDNCQAGVFGAYAHPSGLAALVDGELYVPKKWFDDEKRDELWDQCHIPSDLQFKTKPELALQILHRVLERKRLTVSCVLADEAFGNNPEFLDGIPQGLPYFCEMPKTTYVWQEPPPQDEAEPPPGSKPVRVEELASKYASSLEWHRNVVLKDGAHGNMLADVARLRVARAHQVKQKWFYGPEVWFFLRRNPATGEIKYYLSSVSANASMDCLIWLSVMRWPVETCFEEGKDQLGMDHYQVRTWTGWHHHMTQVFLAQHFLVQQRIALKKTRRGQSS